MPEWDEGRRASDIPTSPGGGMDKFAKELQEATKSLGQFDKATEQTTKTVKSGGGLGRAAASGAALVGAGFAANTAMKVGRQAVRAAGFDLLNWGATSVAGGLAGMDVKEGLFSGAKGLATSPTISKAMSLDLTLKPFMSAGQRTLGITGALARLGVPEADIAEVRGGVFKQFAAEEKRAAVESRSVDKLVRSEFGDEAMDRVGALATKAGEMMDIGAHIDKAVDRGVAALADLIVANGLNNGGGA